jgi:isoleucyl-tRNA synthetase
MGTLYDRPRAELTEAEREASLRYQVMDVAEQARWIPSFGRERELDWLRNMHDWMISKKRYWGLALPIWVCESCGAFDVLGGREELRARAVEGWSDFDGHSPHRPFIDRVVIACQSCGAKSRRIPEVGNPWLDAGSVPFSTMSYNTDREYWARWYPADFITESFPGQFRNWFYSLLVMSTVLARRAPFRAVLGFATLVAEDGREMHKSWGNSIEFNEAAEQIGSDVMRWLYMSHRPDQNLRFGYHVAADVRRSFLLPLWNVYAFFVQYANATPWAPGTNDTNPTAEDPAAREMDHWVRIRAMEMTETVAERLRDYDPPGATASIAEFVEDLSNWYVRRSRRRFWDGDPAALACLYEVLVKLVKVLAPILPFTAETMYQNLVRSVDAEAATSVHLNLWPAGAPLAENERRLLSDMRVVTRLAGLGRTARSVADIKLRQPLAKAMVAVPDATAAAAVDRLASTLADELNVKSVQLVTEEGDLVSYSVRPVLPRLGPRHGPRMPAIRAALLAMDPSVVAATVRAGRPVSLDLPDGPVELSTDDIEVVASARAGWATAEDGGFVVGLDTEVTPVLRAEGVARDLIRSVNQLRKDSGLDISDRIRLAVDPPSELAADVSAWRDVIAAETLALSIEIGPVSPGPFQGEARIDGVPVPIGLSRP